MSDQVTSTTSLSVGLCYLTSKGKQLTAGVSTSKVIAHEPFPSVGNEGDGRPLHSALIIQRSGPPAYLGKTAAHFGSSANYGHDGSLAEATEKEHYLQLHSCILSSPSTPQTTPSSSSNPQPSLPSSDELAGQYVWMDAKVLLATAKQLSSRLPSPPARVDLEPLRRFIMYVDGGTGLVSNGGDVSSSFNRTHIPIRAHHEGGIHPGQWRVGGEASFGWGGKCHFCTTASSSSQQPVMPTISIQFDVLCYRPNIPQVLQPYILLPVRPRYLGRGFGNGPISSIADLLAWRSPSSSSSLPQPLPPTPFPLQHGHGTARRPVVVCHDFKGGYNGSDFPEFIVSTDASSVSSPPSPSSIAVSDLYTLPWHHVETFIYFSHARVTVPPREWINACHKHGVRCLGTILFEGHDGHLDMMRMLESESSVNAAVDKFVDVALELGFDGYLLNCESPIASPSPFLSQGGASLSGVMLRLQMFVAFLTQRLHSVLDDVSVGGGGVNGAARRASVIWYDAITIDGHVSYQNGITNKNVTFASLTDGLFTNYWWRPGHLQVSSSTLALQSSSPPPSASKGDDGGDVSSPHHPGHYPAPALLDRKALVGIDVFGRGTYGGGGFDSGEAVKEIVKGSQGQGVALFAPAWTLEVAGKGGRSNFLQADERFWKGLEESCGGSGAGRRGGIGAASTAPHSLLFPSPGTIATTNQQQSSLNNKVDISLKTKGVFRNATNIGISEGIALGNPFADSKDWGLRRLPFVLNFADSFGTSAGGDETSSSSLRWCQLSAGDPVICGGNVGALSSSSGPLRTIVTKPSEVPTIPATTITTTSSSPRVIPLPFRKGLELIFSSMGSLSDVNHVHTVGSSLLPVCRGPGVTISSTSNSNDGGRGDTNVLYLSVVVESPTRGTAATTTTPPYEQCWYVWVGCGGDVSAHATAAATNMALVPLTRQSTTTVSPSSSPRHELYALDIASLSTSTTSTITLFGLATGIVHTTDTYTTSDDDEFELVIRNLSLFTGKKKIENEASTTTVISPSTPLPSPGHQLLQPTTTAIRQYKDNKYLLDLVLDLGGYASGDGDTSTSIFSICIFGRFTDEGVVMTPSSPISLLLLQQQGGMQFLGVHSLEGVQKRAGKENGDNEDVISNISTTYFISTAVNMMMIPQPAPSSAGSSKKKPTAMEVCVVPSLWSAPGLWRGDLMQCLSINIT